MTIIQVMLKFFLLHIWTEFSPKSVLLTDSPILINGNSVSIVVWHHLWLFFLSDLYQIYQQNLTSLSSNTYFTGPLSFIFTTPSWSKPPSTSFRLLQLPYKWSSCFYHCPTGAIFKTWAGPYHCSPPCLQRIPISFRVKIKVLAMALSCPQPSCARAVGEVADTPKKIPGDSVRDIWFIGKSL